VGAVCGVQSGVGNALLRPSHVLLIVRARFPRRWQDAQALWRSGEPLIEQGLNEIDHGREHGRNIAAEVLLGFGPQTLGSSCEIWSRKIRSQRLVT